MLIRDSHGERFPEDSRNQLDAEKFRGVLLTAETAASSSCKVLGDVFDIVAQFRRQASPPTAAASTKMVVFSWNSPSTGNTFLLDAGMERAFRMLFQARTRTLMLPKDQERFEAYLAFGVTYWVRETLRRMTDKAVANLRGIGSTDTYTPENGSGELNMGQDLTYWRVVARNEIASHNREQKREWLTAIRQRLDAELNAVIDETQDACCI